MGATPAAFGAAIARAVAGCPPGSILVQVREKDLDGGPLLELVDDRAGATRAVIWSTTASTSRSPPAPPASTCPRTG